MVWGQLAAAVRCRRGLAVCLRLLCRRRLCLLVRRLCLVVGRCLGALWVA